MAEINKRVSLHTLRHSFAAHLLDTTALYTRVATKTISEVMNPLEHIALKRKEIRPPGRVASDRVPPPAQRLDRALDRPLGLRD